ncbi:MAG: hydroxylamine oxidoreductase, partial [Desulfobacterales bacterium]|nr:hydroxylamine oxidoreductase [Desulfobacterales bacterium]
MKRIIIVAGLVVGLAGLVMAGSLVADAQTAGNQAKEKEFRIERSMPKEAVACIECHKRENPGIFADWAHSRHASANITCL